MTEKGKSIRAKLKERTVYGRLSPGNQSPLQKNKAK